MRGNLFPTTVYLDEETRNHVHRLAVTTGKPKAAIVREALATGLNQYHVPPPNGAKALLELATWAEENNVTGPKDLSQNLDSYLWEDNA